MSRRLARVLLALLLLALFVGTQMPNAWRTGIEQIVHAPGYFSSLAHFMLFSGMAWVLTVRPLAWSVRRTLAWAFALALLTECLQFFAIGRHPRWLDVGIDMAGALLVVLVNKKQEVCSWLACR